LINEFNHLKKISGLIFLIPLKVGSSFEIDLRNSEISRGGNQGVCMDFQRTYLPDTQIYREAFKAGWTVYLVQHDRDAALATRQYLRGPVAMARLIQEHGGDVRQIAAAACLAGPAVFSEHPAHWLDKRLVEFSREIRSVGTTSPRDLYGIIPGLSADARLFLQASAIMLMEQLSVTAEIGPSPEQYRGYTEALELYSCARGTQDVYKLDTRFEIAAMKATTVMEDQPRVWSKPRQMVDRLGA
jgi:hypothetical protein